LAVSRDLDVAQFFPDRQLLALGVDGFWLCSSPNVAEDGSAGTVEIILREAPNTVLPQSLNRRAYIFTNMSFLNTVSPAFDREGYASLIGKTRLGASGEQFDIASWSLFQDAAGVTAISDDLQIKDGSSTSAAVRKVGWVIPLHGDSQTRPWALTFRINNANSGSWSIRLGGYYLDLTPGRRLPTLNELGLV